jgi:hypothetical protein
LGAKNKETPPANWRALIIDKSTRHLKAGPSWLRWRVAGSAEKAAAIPRLNDLKAVWNVIHVKFPRASVCCRKLGFAHLSALRTSKNFNPTIAGHPIYGHALLFVPTRALPQCLAMEPFYLSGVNRLVPMEVWCHDEAE